MIAEKVQPLSSYVILNQDATEVPEKEEKQRIFEYLMKSILQM